MNTMEIEKLKIEKERIGGNNYPLSTGNSQLKRNDLEEMKKSILQKPFNGELPVGATLAVAPVAPNRATARISHIPNNRATANRATANKYRATARVAPTDFAPNNTTTPTDTPNNTATDRDARTQNNRATARVAPTNKTHVI